jgi:ferredoxin/flavodoxin---NADP+ reductase
MSGQCKYAGKQFKIIQHKEIVGGDDAVYEFRVEAPDIARNAQAGQFVIVRCDDGGERIPLTIADFDPEAGWISLIFQVVGRSTADLGRLVLGDEIVDVLGPLGTPIPVHKYDKPVICVGGGIGVAPIYPKVKALRAKGTEVISIIGARNKGLLILEDEMRAQSSELHITTDDGSYGRKGFVTQALHDIVEERNGEIEEVIAVGPIPMMQAVVKEVAGKQWNESYNPHEDYSPDFIKTIVSLNPIMVDGTGMCGGCRINLWDPEKNAYNPEYTCVTGPAYDGHCVDFETMVQRNKQYIPQEKLVIENG